MILRLRATRDEDAVTILPYLRERERSRVDSEAIKREIAQSVLSYTVTIDDVPAIVWGVKLAAMTDDRAYVWMLATTLVERYPITFLRQSRTALRAMADRFSLLYGLIEAGHHEAERWLRWLGAEIVEDDGRYKTFRIM